MIFQGNNWLTQNAVHIYAPPPPPLVYKPSRAQAHQKMLTNEYKPWATVRRYDSIQFTQRRKHCLFRMRVYSHETFNLY